MKNILKSVCLVVLCSLVGIILLTAVFLMPVNTENKAESLLLLEEEGWYPATPMHKLAYSEYFHSYLPGVMDNHTDRIMISTALDENAGNPILRSMNMYSDYLKENYARYWHGYVIVLRPLLYFFNYADIRIINGLLQIFIVFLLAHNVCQKKGVRYGVLMLTSYALLMPLALAVSLQFSWVFYIGALGCLALLTKTEYWSEKTKYIYLFVIIGVLTSYFDLLTYPLYTWAFPVLWWLITDRTLETRKGYMQRCVYSGAGWLLGYAGMWSMKWVLASLLTGRNVIEDAVGKVQEHSASLEEVKFTFASRLEAAYLNWRHYEYSVYMLMLVVWFVWLVMRSFKKGWHLHKNSMSLLTVSAASPVWYFVLAEHTSAHHFFTYRIWCVTILAVLGILLQATDEANAVFDMCEFGKAQTDGRKSRLFGRLRIFGIWALAALCGAVLMLTVREPLTVINGSADNMDIFVTEGSCIEVDFIPTFSKITQIGLVVKAQKPEGFCEIEVSRGGEVLYRECISLAQYTESTYMSIGVDWSLKAREIYEMKIYPVDTHGPLDIVVTLPTLLPLNELQNMKIGGQETGGQPIMGINYITLPTSRKRQLFLTCCYGAFCAAVILSGTDFALMQRKKRMNKK